LNSADYVHLLRLNEQASRDSPQLYRRRVLRFALLGYLAVLACVLLGLAGLLGIYWHWQSGGRPGFWMVWLGLACLGLLAAGIQGLRVPFSPPEGQVLTAEDAPELFARLEKIRAKVRGPRLDAVLVCDDFNAAIVQQPLLMGLMHRNYLLLGWPLLAALEPRRMLAVIAHEYGHLRGDHGKLGAWIYRTRLAWARLGERYQDGGSALSWALALFVRWYFPRFNALSFALARQDEYEADRVSARLLSPPVAGAALQEIALKARWYAQEYWRQTWRRARVDEQPRPFTAMAAGLQQPLAEDWLRRALREELKQLPNSDDTHPVLKDRLAGLGQAASLLQLPQLSCGHSLLLLGSARERIGASLDAAWWERNRAEWRSHGERLRKLQGEAAELQRRARAQGPKAAGGAAAAEPPLQAADWLRWAEATEALSEQDPSPLLERALQLTPGHPEALLKLAAREAPLGDARVGDWLEQLYQRHEEHAWSAAELAVVWIDACQDLDRPLPPPQRRQWRDRLTQSAAQEQQAWERFAELPAWEYGMAPDIDEEALRRLRGVLLLEPQLRAAWLGEQRLDVKPQRRHFTVWVEAKPGWSDDSADALAQRLFERLAEADLPGRRRVLVLGRHVEPARCAAQPELKLLVQRR